MYYVYFLRSLKNNKIYVGFTKKDPKMKVIEHNKGSTPWTRQNKPLVLIYYEDYVCELDARRRERFYKSGFGKSIKYLIVSSVSSKGRSANGRG